MFGYINPDKPYLFVKDANLYEAMYCGICRSIGRSCGQAARTALTYDIAFASAMVHNIKGVDVKVKKRRCATHFIKRRPMCEIDDISLALGCMNTALAYHKLCDDARDGQMRGVLRFLYKRGYRKVLKKQPKIAEIITIHMNEQIEVEKRGSAVIDEAAEPSALMMEELSEYLLEKNSTPATRELFYAIGKWIYLVDAVDDYDKDVKKGRYNVLHNVYGTATFEEALEKGREEMSFVFDELFAEMREALGGIHFSFNHDLTDNIILRGIPLKTRSFFEKSAKPKTDAAADVAAIAAAAQEEAEKQKEVKYGQEKS